MLGLTPLGTFHTAISLIAVGTGLVAMLGHGQITPKNLNGRVYLATTLITVITGFGIFQHGGFGRPHALGILTLIVLVIALVAARTRFYGRASPYVETVAYTATFFFHFIPGIVETTTRLPLGKPLLQTPDDPPLQIATGVIFLALVVVATLQVRHMRAARHPQPVVLVQPGT
jgi:uncharacterized membrane protein